MNDTGNKNRAVESECGPFHLSQLRGAQSIVFTKAPYLLSAASVAGSKEAQGPLGKYFDLTNEDDLFGAETWEEAESNMQKEACVLALGKSHVDPKSVRYLFGGDLLRQGIATSMGVEDLQIPIFGLYGALFIPVVAMSIYQQMDKTMLGLLSTYEQVGYYSSADKIVNIPLGIITGLGTVSLPRIVSLISEKKIMEYKKVVEKSISLVMFMCSAIAFGILAVSQEFVPLFFGSEFLPCVSLISFLAFVIFFKAISTVIVNQILIPNDNERYYIISVFVGAFINLILNYSLIRKFDAVGAVYATLISELIVCFVQIFVCFKYLNVLKMLGKNFQYIILGVLMYASVRGVAEHITNISLFKRNVIEILVGGAFFSGACLVYWTVKRDDTFYPIVITVLNKIKWKES